MSGPIKVDLVAWSGDISQLATRLRMSEADVMRRLKPLARPGKSERRLVVAAPVSNAGPILSALQRRFAADGVG